MDNGFKATDNEEVSSLEDISEKLPDKMSNAEKKYVRELDYVYVLPFVFIISFLQVKRTKKNIAKRKIIH
jgi:hypothetical protein